MHRARNRFAEVREAGMRCMSLYVQWQFTIRSFPTSTIELRADRARTDLLAIRYPRHPNIPTGIFYEIR